MIETFLTLHPYEQIGLCGFALYVMIFTALTFGWLDADSILFFVLSMATAVLILTGLQVSFNLAAAYIQVFKFCMCVIAIGLRIWRSRKTAAVAGT